jgi:hypothetical protein
MMMAMNINEAIEALVNKGATMWAQFAQTCANAVKTVENKADKTSVDMKKSAGYSQKVGEFEQSESATRKLVDKTPDEQVQPDRETPGKK